MFCQWHKVITIVFFSLVHVKGEGEFIPESQDHVVCILYTCNMEYCIRLSTDNSLSHVNFLYFEMFSSLSG